MFFRFLFWIAVVAAVWAYARAKTTMTSIASGTAGAVDSASTRADVGRDAGFRAELQNLQAVDAWRSQFTDADYEQEADADCVTSGNTCPTSWVVTGVSPQFRNNCSYPFSLMKCDFTDTSSSPVWITAVSGGTGLT